MALELNKLSNARITEICRNNPDEIYHMTITMADACKQGAEKMYVISSQLIDGLEADVCVCAELNEFAHILAYMQQVLKDTDRIFKAANKGLRQADRYPDEE